MSDSPDAFVFRGIELADIASLFEVRVRTWHNERGAEELKELGITPDSVAVRLRETHRGWLCESDGHVVGFAIGNRADGELWVIAVLPEFENRGIGRHLLSKVEDWLASFRS